MGLLVLHFQSCGEEFLEALPILHFVQNSDILMGEDCLTLQTSIVLEKLPIVLQSLILLLSLGISCIFIVIVSPRVVESRVGPLLLGSH